MPSAEMAGHARTGDDARVERAGDTLRFGGALLRAQCAALWRQALPLLRGARRFALQDVTGADSAGIALLAELAARADHGVTLDDEPDALRVLRAAYRLGPALAFA
ncbi:MAG: STAS domain-containing protein [Luteimonas sp.]